MKGLLTAIAILLLTITGTVQAQDAKAKGILEAASKKMGSLKSLKAGFTLKMLGKTGKLNNTTKGSFAMKGQMYHITLKEQEIISDGKTVWTYMKDANEVQVSTYDPAAQSLSPAKLFTNVYDKDYSYRYVGPRTVAGKACDVVEMLPSKTDAQFRKVELAIDKTGTIAGGNIFEKNGNQYQYEVSSVTTNAAIADSQFAFDAKTHPGVEVVDLR